MKDVTPEIQSDSVVPATNEQLATKRNPIAIIGVIVILAAIVFGVWQLAHLIGR